MNIDKKLLKKIKILYVEDDDNIRNELVSLFSNFFDIVYSAKDGQEGLDLYKEKQEDINVIIADINMPNLNGINMLKKIREFDKEINVIFATAYSDSEFLNEAIKLKVYDYITKPIDIRKLIEVLNELAISINQDFLVKQQNKELKKYKDIIYTNNIVIRTNKNLKITYINELFCEITGFDKKELIGKEFIELFYSDSDVSIYAKIKNQIYNNKQYYGKIKNKTKDGNYYIADTTVISTLNDSGSLTGALIIQKDKTKEVKKRREVQNYLIKDKGEIFIKGKESNAELQYMINDLKDEININKKEYEKEKIEKEKYLYVLDKYSSDNKKMKKELSQYKQSINLIDDKYKHLKKIVKENSDFKIEVTKLNNMLENLQEEHEKEIKQITVNHEVKVDDLEEELTSIKSKLDNIEDAETIAQKLTYWQEKAKSEAKKMEKIEHEILNFGDKKLMKIIFGGKA